MKQEIHPDYKKTVVRCACGAEFETRSTKQNIRVEVCSQCHPFFTGAAQHRFIDSEGRIERFRKKYGQSESGK